MEPSIAQRVEVLEGQVFALRCQAQAADERMDTVCSPPWKRLWWFLLGYRLWSVGRWYGKTEELR